MGKRATFSSKKGHLDSSQNKKLRNNYYFCLVRKDIFKKILPCYRLNHCEIIMQKEIIQLLHEKRLKEAFAHIKEAASTLNDWELQSQIETQQTTYNYMLQYTAMGTQDPQRENIYQQLMCKAYELTDKTFFLKEQEKAYGYYADKFRKFAQVPPHSFKEIDFMLEAAGHPSPAPENETEKEAQTLQNYTLHKNAVDELFNKIWVSTQWSEEEYQEARLLLTSPSMATNDKAVMISALTLNLLQIFDVRKFTLLLSACQMSGELAVSQRALTGIALVTYFQPERISLYPDLVSALKLMADNPVLLKQLHDIQIILLLSRETEKIDKKMREEIIPQMMRNPNLRKPELKAIEIEDIEDLNPEWQKDLEKIGDHIRELGELQMEGADTYMTAFSQLKTYPFFQEAAHWFYLFSMKVPDLYQIYKDKTFEKQSLLGMVVNSQVFCDSDKYSFCLAMKSLPHDQQTFMLSKMSGEEIIPKEIDGSGNPAERQVNAIQRQYVHNLYRFYKLWRFRTEQHDIFKDKLDFWNNPLLRPLILKGKYHEQIAGYLFSKGYMQEAAALYETLVQKEPDQAETWQKLGFAYQKNKLYEKAVNAYQQADLIKPDHLWTLKHLAHCYKLSGDFSKATQVFQRVLAFDPDNLNTLMQVGQCLAAQKEYAEAIKLFFKVEFLESHPEKARRAIGWCYFMSGKYEEAIRMYEKLLALEKPQANDWLNSGHVYLAMGQVPQALEHYRKAAADCASTEEFISLFLADKEALSTQGISDCQIYLITDILR